MTIVYMIITIIITITCTIVMTSNIAIPRDPQKIPTPTWNAYTYQNMVLQAYILYRMFIMSSFTNGQMCCQCLARFPWPFYKCKTPDCHQKLCEDCSIAGSGFCGGGGACNGPDRNDYLAKCKKRPAAAVATGSTRNKLTKRCTECNSM